MICNSLIRYRASNRVSFPGNSCRYAMPRNFRSGCGTDVPVDSSPVMLHRFSCYAPVLITQGSDKGQNVLGQFPNYHRYRELARKWEVSHYGAPHETIGELMEEFVSFVRSRGFQQNHPVIKALLAHFFLA